MILWLFIAAMTLGAVAAIVLPILRARPAAESGPAYDRAVYRDQLKEIERDVERGVLSPAEAAAARLEIERRLLATASREGAPAAGRVDPLTAISLAAAVSAGGIALYLALGSPAVQDQPIAERSAPPATAAKAEDLAKSADRLVEKLRQNPDDIDGWMLLARTQSTLQRWDEAARAYAKALALAPGRADAASGYGEMLTLAAGGIVTPDAEAAFETAVKADPHEAAARYYLGLAAAQAGKPHEAVDMWAKLLAEAPPDAPFVGMVRGRIEETARAGGFEPPKLPEAQAAAPPAAGPSAGDMAEAAKMSPEERQKMVRSMVEGLAARLEKNPDDAAGWLRLGRAYRVMGEKEKAGSALAKAAALRPEDPDILLEEAHLVLEMEGKPGDPTAPLPERFVALMKRVAEKAPTHPEALWYLGLDAAQHRDRAAASAYWERLVVELPEGSAERKTVQQAVDTLKKPR